MKIKEFIIEKLENFKKFIKEELEKVTIAEKDKEMLIKDLQTYSDDVNSFTQAIIQLSKYEIDKAVAIFLLNYNIILEDIIDKIEYNKLKRYLQMFINIVNK